MLQHLNWPSRCSSQQVYSARSVSTQSIFDVQLESFVSKHPELSNDVVFIPQNPKGDVPTAH